VLSNGQRIWAWKPIRMASVWSTSGRIQRVALWYSSDRANHHPPAWPRAGRSSSPQR
jgi:hypothetical protein